MAEIMQDMNDDQVTDAETGETSVENVDVVIPNCHPLKHRWTYWYLNDQRNKTWEERLKKVACFETVEEFWGLYLNIRTPSMLHIACDYNVFKEDIQPMWEVKENAKGGRWLITIERSRYDLLDAIWLEVLMAVIGDQFGEYTKDICGIVANIRAKGSKISMWTTNSNDDEANLAIGEVLKKKLTSMEVDTRLSRAMFDANLRYEDHQEVQNKSGSLVKAKHVIQLND
ncbi:hypothetical protein AB6A40_009889 [Gnathostoma spinigerum]|uniref:eIF-4F 25 kDa subunit n=1 Tax=Gnathostoma spinigerum TaxID=75299 RepID=A0ABD6ET84_9BILA